MKEVTTREAETMNNWIGRVGNKAQAGQKEKDSPDSGL